MHFLLVFRLFFIFTQLSHSAISIMARQVRPQRSFIAPLPILILLQTRSGAFFSPYCDVIAGPEHIIQTTFDFAEGLEEALRHSADREDTKASDSEDAEVFNGEMAHTFGSNAIPASTASSSRSSTPSPSRSPSPMPFECSDHDTSPPLTGKVKRKRAYKTRQRCKRRRKERQSADAWDYKPPIYVAARDHKVEVIPCLASGRSFQRAEGAWIGKNLEREDSSFSLEDLTGWGFRVIHWNGRYGDRFISA